MTRRPKPFLHSLVALGLVLVPLVIAAGPAQAHADVESTVPADGAQLPTAPRRILIAFEEHVGLATQGTKLIDGSGRAVQSSATVRGSQLTITPLAPLPDGRYAAQWHVISHDGDDVSGAIAFTVHTPNPTGPSIPIVTKPSIAAVLSAASPGSRTVTMLTKARRGEVSWSSDSVPGPIRWSLRGNGTKASANGVLPTAGLWRMSATLEMDAGSIVVVQGAVTLAPAAVDE